MYITQTKIFFDYIGNLKVTFLQGDMLVRIFVYDLIAYDWVEIIGRLLGSLFKVEK